jgi:hypothetical protein
MYAPQAEISMELFKPLAIPLQLAGVKLLMPPPLNEA